MTSYLYTCHSLKILYFIGKGYSIIFWLEGKSHFYMVKIEFDGLLENLNNLILMCLCFYNKIMLYDNHLNYGTTLYIEIVKLTYKYHIILHRKHGHCVYTYFFLQILLKLLNGKKNSTKKKSMQCRLKFCVVSFNGHFMFKLVLILC